MRVYIAKNKAGLYSLTVRDGKQVVFGVRNLKSKASAKQAYENFDAICKKQPATAYDGKLPAPGDYVWFVLHGRVLCGRVSNVEEPGSPMAYACIFVSHNGGTICLHGRDPARTDDKDGWYARHEQAIAEIDAEKARRKWIAENELIWNQAQGGKSLLEHN